MTNKPATEEMPEVLWTQPQADQSCYMAYSWNVNVKQTKYIRDDIVAEKDRDIASLTARAYFVELPAKALDASETVDLDALVLETMENMGDTDKPFFIHSQGRTELHPEEVVKGVIQYLIATGRLKGAGE